MTKNSAVLAGFLAASVIFAPQVKAQTPTSTLERVSSFEYDANGLLTREVVEPDRPNDCLRTDYAHDAYGNRTSVTSQACAGATGSTVLSAATPRATTTAFAAQAITIEGVSYASPAGLFATTSSNALSQTETKEYDPRHGGMTRLQGPNGGVTTWTYDAFGRKTRESRADGTYTLWSYKLCSAPEQAADALCTVQVGPHVVHWYVSESNHATTNALLAPVKHQLHDALDRVVRVQTKDFHDLVVVQDTHYNSLGQVSQKSILYRISGGTPHWTTFSYDALGRATAEAGPDGNGGTATTLFAYNGLVTTVTNPLNQTQTTHKNASGQTAKVVDHLGSEVVYTHDALGQLIQTNAAGSVTLITYNRRGQKQSMRDPAMGAWDYAYNAFGELVSQQDSLSQTTTMAYDVLGRMTQRIEPDLTSNWYYDRRANNDACGAGIGKLCEATANNGYRRIHTYDALGRPTNTQTALDSASVLASVAQTYHPQTARVATQTWPTGYQASYAYTSTGFLSTVTGGGVTGHTQVVSLEVLAMDPQGRITQYRQGNDVTTVKAYDQPTGKLHSIQATKQGQSTGNVLNHAYTMDKLGNLLTRTDANTGVAESYQYDGLNRLSMYTATGGGISGTKAIQMLYDAAGNLKYKSDVGYYHYDPVRPNRLNHVTLAPESGWSAIGSVSQANTGTRALSYAFDDSRAGARSIPAGSATLPMGNGNLWYTVSQDQPNGRHTVRWETYTSFNMPKEILLNDLIASPGTTPANVTGYTCPSGYTLSGTNCTRTVVTPTSTAATPVYSCPATYTLNGTTCSKVNTTAGSPYCKVPGATLSIANNRCDYGQYVISYNCPVLASTYGATQTGFYAYAILEGEHYGTCQYAINYSCPSGYTGSGASCSQTLTQAANLSYSCPSGMSLSGTTCNGTTSTVQSIAANPIYSCPVGTALNGAFCSDPTTAVAERTLSFAYGPEHQRIRQTVALTSTAPTHMEAGTIWYLNGTDSQGLTYEKEIKANGTTEHKHYVSAGGMSFALYVKREGNLNGLPAATISYLHHDHLGSAAVITNEAGTVTERLAYDPWGKRRQTNGQSDVNDALYGVYTDRGYTMHEHLDEMGIVHMNGRIYDPLIGRFMSADPFIQAPGNLQSYNRYAYVLNNPLAYTDPSGYFSFKQFLKTVVAIAVAVAIQDWTMQTVMWALAPTSVHAATIGAIAGGAAGGFAGGVISGGDLKAGIQGAFTGGMFGAAGTIGGAESAARYTAHAVSGCVSALSSGGKCGSGSVSALFGKFTTNAIGAPGDDSDLREIIGKGVATAVAGGVGAVIAGGKFANGAETATYAYLFNACSIKCLSNAFAKGVQGTASMVRDFEGAGWIEVGTEVNIRTRSGIEGRVDAVLLYKKDGQTVFIVGEAKNGPYADLARRQKIYLQEISAGEFEFVGPKGRALTATLESHNASLLGVTVRSFGNSPAENRPTGKMLNEALRDAAGQLGIRGGWFSE